MALRDRIQLLSTPDEVDVFLARHPEAVIFKAGLCHQTPDAFACVEASLEGHADLPVGVIEVVESREASQHLAARTGVTHQSPQFLLFRAGRVVFNKNRWEITRESVRAALSPSPSGGVA